MKIVTRFATILALAVLVCGSAFAGNVADKWQALVSVNAGFIAVQTLDLGSGKTDTKFTNTVLSGIEFFRSDWHLGLSAGAAAIFDEQSAVPRVAPYAALHLGIPAAQFFAGAAYDAQHGGGNGVVAVFGFSSAFDVF